MIVVDASVIANVVGDDGPLGHQARAFLRQAGELAAPDLVDVETAAVLRKLWLAGTLTETRFASAVADLTALAVVRHATLPLIRRAFELRANVTAYGAMYVALAEGLACPLVTIDARLANAPGLRCEIGLMRP